MSSTFEMLDALKAQAAGARGEAANRGGLTFC